MHETTDRNLATEQFSSVVNAQKQSVSFLSHFLSKFTFQKCKHLNNPKGVVLFKTRVVTLFNK